MNSTSSNTGGYFLVFIIVAVIIGFIILMIHGAKKGAKQGREFREKVSRQNQELKTMVHNANSDSADQIRKLKALLDEGAITQDEFDAKKKQILGI